MSITPQDLEAKPQAKPRQMSNDITSTRASDVEVYTPVEFIEDEAPMVRITEENEPESSNTISISGASPQCALNTYLPTGKERFFLDLSFFHIFFTLIIIQ